MNLRCCDRYDRSLTVIHTAFGFGLNYPPSLVGTEVNVMLGFVCLLCLKIICREGLHF